MHSGGTETVEKPVAETTRKLGPDNFAATPTTIATFADRHIGPNADEVAQMLRELGFENLDALVDATVPENIRLDRPLDLPKAKSENEALAELRALSSKNKVARNFTGAGYSDTITPPVIQRNILENPGWYTAYTPYQAELAQGRLEALLNFQTMVSDLTALEIANASLLDEATAAAEAMHMMASSLAAEVPRADDRGASYARRGARHRGDRRRRARVRLQKEDLRRPVAVPGDRRRRRR